jgi:hypothetical protein
MNRDTEKEKGKPHFEDMIRNGVFYLIIGSRREFQGNHRLIYPGHLRIRTPPPLLLAFVSPTLLRL